MEKMMKTSLLSFSKKIRQLSREENEKCKEENLLLREAINMRQALNPIISLIIASYDISSIVDVNFKEKFKGHQHLFDAAFNDMLDTNSLAWIYKFSKNNNDSLSEENMHNLVTSAIKTNIPAYMYLVAVKINNIPDEDMKQLIAAIVASNDRKYIDDLSLIAYKNGVSNEVKRFMLSCGISIDMETNYYDDSFANELEQALLEDNLETLYKHGMYSYEDRAYVLSNIQAGL